VLRSPSRETRDASFDLVRSQLFTGLAELIAAAVIDHGPPVDAMESV